MLDFIRHPRKMSTSRPSSLRSSVDDGPSRASSVAHPGQTPINAQRHASNATQASSFQGSQVMPSTLPHKLSSYAHAIPSASTPSTTQNPIVSRQINHSSPRFSQASAVISKPSPTFVAAHGEFNSPGDTTSKEGNGGCVGQMGIEDSLRGTKNPHGLSLDKSTGYFPRGSTPELRSVEQSDPMLFNDRPSLEDLLRMIAAERLHHMPQKGSNFDRSIRALESFALKVSDFASRYTSVVGSAQLKATRIYGECYALLRLIHGHASSFVPALVPLAGVSRALSLFASCPQQPMSSQLQQCLDQILDCILGLLNCMTSYFQDISVGFGAVTGPAKFRHSLSKPLEAFNFRADQLLNEIWTYHIPSSVREYLVQFEPVQQLLQPQDEVVRTTQKLLLAERGFRHEFTCEWFSKPFLDFVRSSDSALWIDGRIGCGKSVLCGWILESLQSSVDGHEYAVAAFTIDSLLPSETNTSCVIKALLRQLIERQYRSVRLYKALAGLVGAVKAGEATVQVEKALWECLHLAIIDAEQPTMLVIDGLSELDGGEATATTLLHNLLRFVTDNPLVRLLVLSRPFPSSSKTSLRRRTIEAGDVHGDILRVISDLVPSHSPTPRSEIARRIEHEADGNFFWSLLALQAWVAQGFSQQMWRTLQTPLEATVVSKINFSDPVTCVVLFNSIIATRPLRMAEIELISRLDVNNRQLKLQAPDIQRAVEQTCGSVLVVKDDLVLFRHSLLRQALLDVLQFGALSLGPEMHADMACRLLLHIKLVLSQHHDLSLQPTPSSTLEILLQSDPLLSYALRYWTKHLVASSMFPEPNVFKPNADCLAVFPDTVYAATIEASFWRHDLSSESVQSLELAASVRKEILGEHEATLQTIVCLAEALRCREDYTGAAIHFSAATEIAQQALPDFHPFTATCMIKFLDVVDLANDNNALDFSSQKSNVLRYLINMYDTQAGPSSDQVLQYSSELATHYSSMQEYVLSIQIYQRVHRLTIDRHGKESSEAKLSAEKLVTALQYQSDQSEEGDNSYNDSVFDDVLQTYDITDARRIKATIAKAEAYRSIGESFNAELVYVNLLHGVAEAYHHQKSLESHEKLLRCGLTYSSFLREDCRMPESQAVLLGLWSQHQASGHESETVFALLGQISTEMKDSGLQDIALDVLNAMLASSEYVNADKLHEARSAITDITLNMVRGPQSDHSNEAALRRFLESKKSQGLTPTEASLVVSQLLSLNRCDNVIAMTSETLLEHWPSMIDGSYNQDALKTDAFRPELADLAESLAQAYTRTNQVESACPIHWRLFQVSRHSNAVENSTAIGYGNSALKAFEQTGQTERLIALREDMADFHIVRFGERHSSTIEALYALASLYDQEQRLDNAKEKYLRISDTLKQPTFHEFAALPALRRLIDICSRQKRWDQAGEAYASLWQTFLAKGREYQFDPSTSKALYTDYIAILRKRVPVDVSAIRGTAEQYRSACLALWGERDPSTIGAVLLLAEIESSIHPHSVKAIQLYESLVDGAEVFLPEERENAKTTLETAEDRLTDFYRDSIANGGQKAVQLQGKTIARAVRLQGRRYQRLKMREGTSRPPTLSNLAIWVSMLAKQGSQDWRGRAMQELQLAIDSVMDSDVEPSILYNAAIILATSFSANGLLEQGLDLVRGLTEQMIFEEENSSRRSHLVFLTAFEVRLRGSVANFDTLKESALWERYKRARHTDKDPGMALASGARLRGFLVEHESFDRAALIEQDLYEHFQEIYGAAFAQGIETARAFFSVLLEELSGEDVPDIASLASAALSKNVGNLLEEGDYMAALDLLLPGFEFLCFVGGSVNSKDSILANGLHLGLMLVVTVPDQEIGIKMLNLSKVILQETLRQCRSQNFNLNLIGIDMISRLASVLGLHQSYEDLEWLLARLWLSRKNLTSLSQDVVIRIGKRLVQVRFFHGHVESAIELGEDILYNVQRVYGTSHPSTLDIASLLSTIYAATGDHAAAKAVVGDASKSKLAGIKGQWGTESNREQFLHSHKRDGDGDVTPTVLQAPEDWGFIDGSDERGFGGVEHAR